MPIAIAIDGPGGSGKSVIAKKLAKELNYFYIDTGAMYRSVALYCIEQGISLDNTEEIITALNNISINMEYENGNLKVFLNGSDVSEKIRLRDAAAGSSKVAIIPQVREKLVTEQRQMAKNKDVVMDGRDIASHVLPDAQVKIYLTADVETRAKRRQLELIEKGISADFEEIKKDIAARDERDMNREISPLIKTNDAVLVDTSHMNIEEVLAHITNIVQGVC